MLPEQLGEVVIIHARVGGAGQGQDPGADRLGEAPRRGASSVAMGQGGEALLAQAGKRPAEMAEREARTTPRWTRARTCMRCCSLWVKVIVSLFILPG